MPNPNPDQSNLLYVKRREQKVRKELAKAKRKKLIDERNLAAKVFAEDLDDQLELKAYDLHIHPNDKDKARNMGIFMRYKLLRDRGTGVDFMDMEY